MFQTWGSGVEGVSASGALCVLGKRYKFVIDKDVKQFHSTHVDQHEVCGPQWSSCASRTVHIQNLGVSPSLMKGGGQHCWGLLPNFTPPMISEVC